MTALRLAVVGSFAFGALAAQAPVVPSPAGAWHEAYGAGCYDVPGETYYVAYADATAAATALSGRSLRLVPTAVGYAGAWGSGGYRAPGATAVALPPSDDGQVAVPLPQPMPIAGTSVATLWIHSNGVVAAGPSIDGGAWNTPPNDFTPSPSFRNAPEAAFWAWHDWNPAEPGSGRIVTEVAPVGGEPVLFVTWRDVENFPATVENRGTFQFQFGLVSGVVVYVWHVVDGTTGSPFGSGHLVGWSPAGPSLDPGPGPSSGSFHTAPDLHALALAASPVPVSTPSAGTTVIYAVSGGPVAARLACLVLALAGPVVVDLAAIGAPGCQWYLAAMDVVLPVLGPATAPAVAVDYPAGLPAGLLVHGQAVAFAAPATWGASANTLGVVTSHGIASRVAPF